MDHSHWKLTPLLLLLSIFACASDNSLHDREAAGSGIALARHEIDRGQYESALSLLTESRFRASSQKEKTDVSQLMGDCLVSLGRYDEAVTSFYRARSANKKENKISTYLISMGLARAYEGKNSWASAERHYLEAVSFAENARLQDRALVRLGKGSLQRGRIARAQSYHDRIHDKTVFGYKDLDDGLMKANKSRGQQAGKASKIQMPSVLAPEILNRSVWGAKRIKQAGAPVRMTRPWRITLHHAASPEIPPTSMSAATAQMRSYQKFHQDNRGWADIGYHYLIDGSGRIWQGRDLKWQGAHAGNKDLNRGNIGICLMGNFVKRDPTPSQKKSLKRLLSWLCESHKIHPHFVSSHRSMLRDVPKKSTLCPGAHLESYLNRIKPLLPRP